MNLIMVTEQDRLSANTFIIKGENYNHLKNILKAKNGDFLSIGILNDSWGVAQVHEMEENSTKVTFIEYLQEHINKPAIDIICALPRPQTLKKVLGTCATMGVKNLYLIKSEKVEKSYFQSPLLKEENYARFLIEGLSQGKRTQMPQVTIHNRFKPFFDDFPPKSEGKLLKLLAHPINTVRLTNFPVNSFDKIIFAIGPEGGWNEFEINHMLKNGFSVYSLGNSILRVENAVTAAISQLDLLSNSF